MIGIQSRKTKTAVFAGTSKQHTYKHVLSLEELCLNSLKDHYREITYLNRAPYYLIKPVLEKYSPMQLFRMEDYNPDLVTEDDELWEGHCKNDFKGKFPSEDESWRELYIRLKYERERKLECITKHIKRRTDEKAEPIRKTKLAFVECLPKPPRGVKRTQEVNGTKYAVAGLNKLGRSKMSSEIKSSDSSSGNKRPFHATASSSSVNSAAKKVKKPAPLMRKTLEMARGRHRR